MNPQLTLKPHPQTNKKQDKEGDDGEDKATKSKKAKEEAKAQKEAFKPLTSWWKDLLGAKVRV